MWVNVNQIYDNMNNPKMQKPMIRDFCEQQVLKNNLEKQTGKDKFVRQAQAEYQMTEKGKRLLAIAKDDSTTSDLISMISWTQNQARKRKESKKQQAEEENPKEDKNQ